ncbi:hypothetical protein M1615_03805 [Patescibacteria group bacterium]|nr:hypothetical protein [Patescibacteria group bacterium]
MKISNITNKYQFRIRKAKAFVICHLSFVICLFVICLFAYSSFVIPKAHGAGLSLAVYPPIIQIKANPPANIKSGITLINNSDTPTNLDILIKPFTASKAEDGTISYLPVGKPFGDDPRILNKIQILQNNRPAANVSLAPGQKINLTLHVDLPKNEPFSDYYFSILFVSKDNLINQKNNNHSTNLAGIATNVLLSIGPKQPIKPQGFIREFSAPFLLEKGPVPFTVRVKNTGRHYIAPKGQILITNMYGQLIGKVELLPVNILAGTTRAIPSSLQPIPSNLSPPTYPAAVWPEKILLGPYKAVLTLALSSQGPVFHKTIYFIAVPAQAIIGFLLVILIIILIRNRLRTK